MTSQAKPTKDDVIALEKSFWDAMKAKDGDRASELTARTSLVTGVSARSSRTYFGTQSGRARHQGRKVGPGDLDARRQWARNSADDPTCRRKSTQATASYCAGVGRAYFPLNCGVIDGSFLR